MSATVAQELAELRRANAELLRERDAAVAALARRNTEYGERIDQQAATIDVLRAMTDSPDDPQPIFDLIVQHARDLCGAYGATVYEFDGTLIHYRAATGVSDDAAVRQRVAAMYPMPLNRYSAAGRAILDRRIIRIDDLESEPGLHPVLRRQTAKSAVVVPLLHGDVAMGALALGSRERGGFSEPQIQLLQTFAEQAVIAITSAETYRALHEALEQQTATAEVLQVINTSPGDLTPVFDAMLERAMRLCGAAYGVLRSFDGERMHMLASRGVPQADAEFLARDTGIVAAGTALIRALETGRPAQNLDAIDSVGYKSGGRAIVDLGGARTILHVPLVKDQTSIGVLTFYRQEVRSFSAKQIALLENFAAQAVIAMENARLQRDPPAPRRTPDHVREYGRRRRDVRRNPAPGRMEPQVPGGL
jgi:two-component system, NtrC family, sensor kinase